MTVSLARLLLPLLNEVNSLRPGMASVPPVQQANVALVLLTSQLLATSSSSTHSPLPRHHPWADFSPLSTLLSPRSFSAVSCPALSHGLCPQAGVLTAPPSLSSCCARGGSCTPEVSAPHPHWAPASLGPLLAPSGPRMLTTSSVAGPWHIHTGFPAPPTLSLTDCAVSFLQAP